MQKIIGIFFLIIFLTSCSSSSTPKLPQAGQETKFKVNSEDHLNNLFIFYPKLEDIFRFQIILDVFKVKESGIGWEILTLNEYVIEINDKSDNRIKPGTWAKINLTEGNFDLNFYYYDSPIDQGPGPELSFSLNNNESKYIILVGDCGKFNRKGYEACDTNIIVTNKEDWTKKVNLYFDKLKSE